jgi:hypothetical protein
VVHFLSSTMPIPQKTVAKSPDKSNEQISNPEYGAWVAKDQQILNYLLSSLSRDILAQVAVLSNLAQVPRHPLKGCLLPNLAPGSSTLGWH